MYHQSILEIIGNTPILEIKAFDLGLCRLFLKLESQNPGGSIKDRIGLSMIEVAEKEGKIHPGSTLIEATAGNTGLGLALTAAQKGYRLILVIPDKMSNEKVLHLKALGAEIRMTRSDVEKGHPEYYQDYAERLAREIPDSYYINQFSNRANPFAHETGTGPEIWNQMDRRVDAISVGVGSSGTLTGLTAFFKKANPALEFILADPKGSILADHVNTGTHSRPGSWLVEGIGEDFIPAIADFSMVKKGYTVTDGESFVTARTLLRKEGILAGSSTGVLVHAAIQYAREQTQPKNIVTFACDSGNKYLSKMFNDYWLIDHGFMGNPIKKCAADLISRREEDHAVVSIQEDDTLLRAYSRMRLHEISQLPVLRDNHLIGILDESDILLSVTDNGEAAFHSKVKEFMTRDLVTIPPDAAIESIVPILKQGLVAVVADKTRFYGLVTQIDFLNYLRLKLRN
ncbi:MAG: pyridoxal-phosphate dependent enzyme [Kiritimatiellia bacterium]